jgi:hypothetical protein
MNMNHPGEYTAQLVKLGTATVDLVSYPGASLFGFSVATLVAKRAAGNLAPVYLARRHVYARHESLCCRIT